jgi:hypothetical protein
VCDDTLAALWFAFAFSLLSLCTSAILRNLSVVICLFDQKKTKKSYFPRSSRWCWSCLINLSSWSKPLCFYCTYKSGRLSECASHRSGRLLFSKHGVVIWPFEDRLSMKIMSLGKGKTHRFAHTDHLTSCRAAECTYCERHQLMQCGMYQMITV